MLLGTFDPKDVAISVSGILMTGLADRMVIISRDNPVARSVRGVDGELARVLTDNRLGTIVLSLQQLSPSNLALSTLVNADELTGVGTFPVLVSDLRGVDLVIAAAAYIGSFPRVAYSRGEEVREWTILALDLRIPTLGRVQTA